MSKIFMDYKASMRDEDNVDDVSTLSWFKAWLGLKSITNQESKIKKPGNFEAGFIQAIFQFSSSDLPP